MFMIYVWLKCSILRFILRLFCVLFRNGFDIFTFHTESLCQKADVPSEERSSKINPVFNISLYTSDLKSTWDKPASSA